MDVEGGRWPPEDNGTEICVAGDVVPLKTDRGRCVEVEVEGVGRGPSLDSAQGWAFDLKQCCERRPSPPRISVEMTAANASAIGNIGTKVILFKATQSGRIRAEVNVVG